MFQDVLGPKTKAKLFRFDPETGVIEIQVRRDGQKHLEVVDLKDLLVSRGGALTVPTPKTSSPA